jgi:putative queuosine salvage protein
VGLCHDVRTECAHIAARARFVRIDLERLGDVEPGPDPALDPERHFLEGSREDVAAYLLALDAINFGSGWFPTLHKREGCSGYFTVAWALADRWRADGPWTTEELAALDASAVAEVLGQDPDHELMGLYARALRDLGAFLAGLSPLEFVDSADRSAERLAEALAGGMAFFHDPPFFKRAQITPNDLALAGVAEFDDLDRLTVFADNLVPHVLRMDGVLRYDPDLVARIDAGDLLEAGSPEEVEIRACAVHAGELLATRLGVPARTLDGWLWNRGQAPRYKARPRHRSRSVFY